MKKLTLLHAIACLTLTFSNHATTEEELFAQEIALAIKEVIYYHPFSLGFYAALQAYLPSNQNKPPEILCKTCHDHSMPCDELLINIQAKSMEITEQTTDNTIIDKAHRNMIAVYTEMTKLLIEKHSMDAIKRYMTKIAREYCITCEGCKKVNWETIETEENSTTQL